MKIQILFLSIASVAYLAVAPPPGETPVLKQAEAIHRDASAEMVSSEELKRKIKELEEHEKQTKGFRTKLRTLKEKAVQKLSLKASPKAILPQKNAVNEIDYYTGPDNYAQRFQKNGTLGKGGFGEVVAAIDHKTKQTVALKLFNKENDTEMVIYNHILNQLAGKRAEKLSFLVPLEPNTFDCDDRKCIVLPYLPAGDLSKRIYADKRMSVADIKLVARQMFEALERLHEMNIIHSDIKPENIALRNHNPIDAVLIDFGAACFLVNGAANGCDVRTLSYMAPERITGSSFNEKIDIWALGVTLLEAFIGRYLFIGKNFDEVSGEICKLLGIDTGRNYHLQYHPVLNPKGYIDWKVIKSLPIKSSNSSGDVNDFLDLMTQCMTLAPKDRISAKEALSHKFLRP